ncbi:hypothetical protein EDB84DRAFT_1571142 [Lactarius hengduanensis]|nr:hypothetical protein EDB84DRAFT_1571142 [Lactarius hengduanensis]
MPTVAAPAIQVVALSPSSQLQSLFHHRSRFTTASSRLAIIVVAAVVVVVGGLLLPLPPPSSCTALSSSLSWLAGPEHMPVVAAVPDLTRMHQRKSQATLQVPTPGSALPRASPWPSPPPLAARGSTFIPTPSQWQELP